MSSKTVAIISVFSDIGNYLAQQYLSRGWRVIGTYRQKAGLNAFGDQNVELFKVDITRKADINSFASDLKRRQERLDRVICLTGSLLPAQDFFECDFDQWQNSLVVNAVGPLRLVHGLYPLFNPRARVVFFAGGGANGPVRHMSAYAVSKIMLTKMTEFIDAEYPGLHVSIIGPGWILTKIHDELILDRKTSKLKREQTLKDLKNRPSTPLSDIDACVEWVCAQPKSVSSGRNFSVVYDPWRKDKRQKLVAALSGDKNMYKLRRHNNHFLQQ